MLSLIAKKLYLLRIFTNNVMKRLFLLCSIIIFTATSLFSQIKKCKKDFCLDKIPLWEIADGSKATTKLYTYIPSNFSSERTPAVIICPGGSYHHLGIDNEGHHVAKWFAEQGIAAFVLRYRVSSNGAHHPDMIQDLQLAIAFLKASADAFEIDTTKIGAIGFSAGGHLVAHGGVTHNNFIQEKYPASKKYDLRPDFVMSIYPVVSMEDSIAHKRSRKNLLTRKFTENDIHTFSLEQNVPNDMPPTFVLACTDDDVVDIRNARALGDALNKKHIKNCMFTELPTGGHGFGMFRTKSESTQNWADKILIDWLKTINVLPVSK